MAKMANMDFLAGGLQVKNCEEEEEDVDMGGCFGADDDDYGDMSDSPPQKKEVEKLKP